MDEQRTRARKAREALGDLGWAGVEFGKEVPETQFVGYDSTACLDCKVVAIVVENELADELMPGVEGIVVLDKTPFYAEMGGQVADRGFLANSDEGVAFTVTDVQKNKGGKFMHYGKVTEGCLKVGGTVRAHIDPERRRAIGRAHSATHLLHAALRAQLGDHVHQAGSLVEPDFLRFDFTHFSAMTAEELRQVEQAVNEMALTGYSITTEEMPIEQAREKGATALFGEKYGDTVRVVSMGEGYSVELCGGTHLDNTAKVGIFHIQSEFSVASGVRRIEAITGRKTLECMTGHCCTISELADCLKTKPVDLKEKAETVMTEIKRLQQQVEKYKAKEAAGGADDLLKNAAQVGDLHVITTTVTTGDVNSLRQLGDLLRDKDSTVVAVIALVGEKVSLLAVCGKDAVAKGIKAGDIIKAIAPVVGGKGGGKPDSAMGGGSDVEKVADALAMVEQLVSDKLN